MPWRIVCFSCPQPTASPMNTECPHCLARVNIGTDGRCPVCRHAVAVAWAEDPVEAFFEPVDEVICPMCGTVSPSRAQACPNCGEEFIAVGVDLWQQGNSVLIMHKNAELPLRCVKSNQPCNRQLKRSLSWHHPAWYLLIIVCGLVPYIIAALIVRKTATIHVGLSEEWFARRRSAMVTGWGCALFGIAMLIAGFATLDTGEVAAATLIIGGIGLLLFGMIFGLVRSRIVEVKKFEGDYIWLKGCHADFLAALPAWTGDMR